MVIDTHKKWFMPFFKVCHRSYFGYHKLFISMDRIILLIFFLFIQINKFSNQRWGRQTFPWLTHTINLTKQDLEREKSDLIMTAVNIISDCLSVCHYLLNCSFHALFNNNSRSTIYKFWLSQLLIFLPSHGQQFSCLKRYLMSTLIHWPRWLHG